MVPGTTWSGQPVAEPAAQHFFVEWTENGTAIPGGPELTFTADHHRQITARFRPFISIATVDDLQKIAHMRRQSVNDLIGDDPP